MDCFIRDNFEPCMRKWRLTIDELLDEVREGRFFGMVECSIAVPDDLREKFRNDSNFQQYIDVARENISDYMKKVAEKQGFLPRPRRCLIGSYFGEKILLATPLLKWYLEEGLKVSEVFQAIQFKPKKCFQALGNEVTFHRSNADANPNLAMKGELFKLLGNSYYGKTITDVEKHTNLSFSKRNWSKSES